MKKKKRGIIILAVILSAVIMLPGLVPIFAYAEEVATEQSGEDSEGWT